MISIPEHLRQVGTYTPGTSAEEIRKQYGLTHVVKLASNENPFGASSLALDAARHALEQSHRYGDGGLGLRMALATYHNHPLEGIVVNNGSDAIIHQIMRTLLLPGETALSSRGGFVSFGIAVRTVGSQPDYVDLGGGYRFDVERLAAAISPSTKIIYIPNPNNPTGTHITTDKLHWLLERVPDSVVVVLDEAYHEYAVAMAPDTYPQGLYATHPNVISLRTFSKAYGLAAFRVGYALGNPELMQWLLKTCLPFDPNGIGCAAAVAALSDTGHVQKTVACAQRGMNRLLGALRTSGYTTSDSITNFVFIDLHDTELAEQFYMTLLRAGFISRPLTGFGIPTAVRITLGTDEQNEQLEEFLTSHTEQFVR
mgnify:CR=1 FL=1